MKTQNFFYVRLNKRYEQVSFDDILYVQGSGAYSKIILEQKTLLVMNTMLEISKHLPADLFCRIHISYMVPFKRVKAFDFHKVWLHEASADAPRRVGLAKITELPVGIKFRKTLMEGVRVMKNKRSGGRYKKTVEELEEQTC